MDIRKLQRAIVDGLEDVKAQDIVVYNTEHLSPLFERIVVASGTSNRQTKALAASVRDAVRARGGEVLSTEGEGNGEWIIVDCGQAVVHVMQPVIRQYYHLEEIWGGKAVRMKLGTVTQGLVKASDDAMDDDTEASPVVKKSRSAANTAAPAVPKKRAATKTTATGIAAKKAAPRKKASPTTIETVVARTPSPRPTGRNKAGFKAIAEKAAGKPARKAPAKRTKTTTRA
ncbi:MAG: ribosome silencing factor [Leptothrix ochracea]|uniref:ribosome silencing factor n=1 Tax=Leptothrix ochracea TaxID=735331 RepID=UPI0034E29165